MHIHVEYGNVIDVNVKECKSVWALIGKSHRMAEGKIETEVKQILKAYIPNVTKDSLGIFRHRIELHTIHIIT